MLRHKHIDRICLAAMALALVLAGVLWRGEELGIRPTHSDPAYASRLFDADRVHTIDIQIEDWQAFLDTAPEEEYSPCTVVVDGERFEQVGLRAKGNNSRRLIEEYGLSRYSLKLEFDHYQTGASYHGLDKLSLDCSFQDNSYLKNHTAYRMMDYMGVPAPLSSYVWVTVNGQDWGLFLAVEEPEEAFARRSFGPDHGQLYKPDYKRLSDENPDVALRYTGPEEENYDNIFRTAKFDPTPADKQRLIEALEQLSTGQQLEKAVDLDRVLRYFVVQVFTVNLDSYLGRTGHNYFLYEEDGRLSMLPWDYNLAFATYSLGMPDPINDAELYVNYPIDTPGTGQVMQNRPLYHQVMKQDECFAAYHRYFDEFLSGYFESGRFAAETAATARMIAPYVQRDPTAFCSYEDFRTGVDTFTDFCLLRAESARGQLEGEIPSTWKEREEWGGPYVDASSVWLPDLGEIADLADGVH